MADKYKPKDKVMAQFRTGEPGAELRLVPATVVEQVSPGLYRCQTQMGVAIVFGEEELSDG